MSIESGETVPVLNQDPFTIRGALAGGVGVACAEDGAGERRFNRGTGGDAEVDAIVAVAVVNLGVGGGKGGVAEVLSDNNLIEWPSQHALAGRGQGAWVNGQINLGFQFPNLFLHQPLLF